MGIGLIKLLRICGNTTKQILSNLMKLFTVVNNMSISRLISAIKEYINYPVDYVLSSISAYIKLPDWQKIRFDAIFGSLKLVKKN
jgi:hypothetical protein